MRPQATKEAGPTRRSERLQQRLAGEEEKAENAQSKSLTTKQASGKKRAAVGTDKKTAAQKKAQSRPLSAKQATGQKRAAEGKHKKTAAQKKKVQDAQSKPPTAKQTSGQKRKRPDGPDQPAEKRQRPAFDKTDGAHKKTANQNANRNNPIDYWCHHLHWPQWYATFMGLRESRTSTSSASATPTLSEERRTDVARYRNPDYEIPFSDPKFDLVLDKKNIFQHRNYADGKERSEKQYRHLFEREQPLPEDTLFSDDVYEDMSRLFEHKNNDRLMRDLSPLLVPSAEVHFIRRSREGRILRETNNEKWNKSVAVIPPRPQPAYGVGFNETAFSETQLRLLQPFAGDYWDSSYFKAISSVYFPFLTCEVDCTNLEAADRKNSLSATVAVRGVVELFRFVNREKELDGEVLAFSISHDDKAIHIYGHYPVIGKDIHDFRKTLHRFYFTYPSEENRWTAYKFTKNVYDVWAPDHLKRICSAIDTIPPGVNFGVSVSALGSEEESI